MCSCPVGCVADRDARGLGSDRLGDTARRSRRSDGPSCCSLSSGVLGPFWACARAVCAREGMSLAALRPRDFDAFHVCFLHLCSSCKMADSDGLVRLLSDHTHALASLHARLGSPPETLQAQLASLQESLAGAIVDQRRALEDDVARIRDAISAQRNEVAQMQRALGEPEPDTDQREGETLMRWRDRMQCLRDSVAGAHQDRSRELRAIVDRLKGFTGLLGSEWPALQGLPDDGDEDKDLRVQKLQEWQGVVVACEHEIVRATHRISFLAAPDHLTTETPANDPARRSHRDPSALVRAGHLALFCFDSAVHLIRFPRPPRPRRRSERSPGNAADLGEHEMRGFKASLGTLHPVFAVA
jgi:hypothetical protein